MSQQPSGREQHGQAPGQGRTGYPVPDEPRYGGHPARPGHPGHPAHGAHAAPGEGAPADGRTDPDRAGAGTDGPARGHTPAGDEPDLPREQFRQLLRYRSLVVAGLLLGLLAGGWLGVLGSHSYAASSEVTLRQPTVDPFAAGGKPADAGISIESERQTAQGSAVAALAAARLAGHGAGRRDGADPSGTRLREGLQVTNPPDTLVLRFTYTARTAREAAARSNAFARAFLDNRERETKAQVAKMLDRYRDQRKPLLAQRGHSDSVDAQLAVLDSKIADLSALDTTSGTVVRAALPPTAPAGPGLPMLLGLGAAAGLLVGLLAAWLRLVFDPTARSEGDVVRALGAPVLGVLPRGRRAGPLLAVGRTAEEYRAVAFRIAYDRRLAQRPRSVLVTAPRGSGDVAAAVAVNLSASFVEMGHDVLLVEADLRTPALAERLRRADGIRSGWSRRPARADGGWPTGENLPIDAGESGAFDLVPGARVRNATRALSSDSAGRLLATAERPGTTVVVYAPAVLSYADAVALADRVGGVLVVCDPREVHRADLARIRELVDGTGGIVLGAVLHSLGDGRSRRARRRDRRNAEAAARNAPPAPAAPTVPGVHTSPQGYGGHLAPADIAASEAAAAAAGGPPVPPPAPAQPSPAAPSVPPVAAARPAVPAPAPTSPTLAVPPRAGAHARPVPPAWGGDEEDPYPSPYTRGYTDRGAVRRPDTGDPGHGGDGGPGGGPGHSGGLPRRG